MQEKPPPFLVFTFGVHRSASTWVSNVVLEILRQREPARLIFAETAEILASEIGTARQAVVKGHMPHPSLQLLLRLAGLPMILSVREPLDCVASLMERQFFTFDSALRDVTASTEAARQIPTFCHAFVLRYEDAASRGPETIRRLADHVGIAIEVNVATAIAEKFAPESVKAYITGLLERGGYGENPHPTQFDPETHWHPNHIGTGASGRHVDCLTSIEIRRVKEVTRDFRRAFGYEAGEC